MAGVVVKQDVEAVADATSMISQPDLWEKYSKAGLEMARQKFAPEAQCAGFADLYRGADRCGASGSRNGQHSE
jgi:hypothetical protein